LAIVKDIVELYKGQLTFQTSQYGGLKIRIEFNKVPEPQV
jgi:signal transduction histidine kinase